MPGFLERLSAINKKRFCSLCKMYHEYSEFRVLKNGKLAKGCKKQNLRIRMYQVEEAKKEALSGGKE